MVFNAGIQNEKVILLSKFAFFTSILSACIISLPAAIASSPVISTKWTIANGAESPPVFLDGNNFASEINKFDFNVDMGSTGLEYDSVAYVNSILVRFVFHGIANTGTITIQANASAFSPVAAEPSNIISIIVPVPFIPQSITFKLPTTMTVKDKDQTPSASSDSGLVVLLSSNTPSTCTIDFLKIHAVAAGTCSITATVNGNLIYSTAIPVTNSFTILPVSSAIPIEPVGVVTNLGSASYDPTHNNIEYVSVLVAALDPEPNKARLVKLLISPGATSASAVFLISSFSSDEDTAAGYFVVRVKAISADGSTIAKLKKSMEINIPPGAADGVPSWSIDGKSWIKLLKLDSEILPPDIQVGYFVEKDSRIAILTTELNLLGFRKNQAPLGITAPINFLSPGTDIQFSQSGGSGTGEVRFYTRTLDACTITPSGKLIGLREGKCIIAATKDASGIYSNAISSAITIFVQRESSVSQVNESDPNHAILCQELSYTLLKSSSLVYVNLCEEDAGETAYLEIGTKSKAGTWSYVSIAKQKLDKNGATLFKLESTLKIGQVIRVKAEGKVQIFTSISRN